MKPKSKVWKYGVVLGVLALVLVQTAAFAQDEPRKPLADANGENLGPIVEVESAQLPASGIIEEHPKLVPPALKKKIGRIPSEIIELPPLDLEKIIEEDEASSGETKRLRVSIHRTIPDFSPQKWRFIGHTNGQYSWRIVIHSPQATFICPQFSSLSKESIQIYLYSEKGIKSLKGPINIRELSRTGYLGPIIEGEYLYIECISGSSKSPPKLKVIGISHGYRSILTGNLGNSSDDNFKKLKESWCYNDVTCYSDWHDTSTGVARIWFKEGGSGYVCTGSLLTDQDHSTRRNWFLTAHHCISSDSVADTLKAYFYYRTSTCNGPPPHLWDAYLVEGSDYVVGSSTSDFTLLELDDYPPAGTWYLGWSTGDIGSDVEIVTIHHPGGSYQRITFGNEDGTGWLSNFWRVKYYSGSTEGKSSGAPLFKDETPHYIRGQLYGGDASCDNMEGHDKFGKFGKSWDLGLSQYLSLENLPDLYDDGESWRSFSPQTVTAGVSGQSFEIHCDIRNGGDADSGSFKVKFYASTGTIIDASDYYIGTKDMSGISAGDWADCDWSGNCCDWYNDESPFPKKIPAGTYYIGWIIDAEKEVCEEKENNNIAYKEGYQLTVVEPVPDLTVLSVTAPTSAKVGDDITVSYAFSNNGAADSGSFYSRISLATTPYGTDIELGTFPEDSVPGGTCTAGESHEVQIPSGVSPGYYYVTVFADVFDGVTESDEDNNINKAPNQIHITSNNPPNTPSRPSGPSSGNTGTSYSYSTSATDPDGDQVKYTFDWGDGSTSETGFVNSGTSASKSHSWSSAGTYYVKAKATDSTGASSGWSSSKTVTISTPNNPPNTPTTPLGPSSGNTGTSYTYSTSATDPDGDQVKYTFDWGDGSTSETGFVNSGTSASKSHSWSSAGTYYVKAKATDSTGASSGWSSSKTVKLVEKPDLVITDIWHEGSKIYYEDFEKPPKTSEYTQKVYKGWNGKRGKSKYSIR